MVVLLARIAFAFGEKVGTLRKYPCKDDAVVQETRNGYWVADKIERKREIGIFKILNDIKQCLRTPTAI